MTRIVLIDDDVLFRKGIKSCILNMPDFEIVGDLSVLDGLDRAELLHPDMVVIDPYPNGGKGLEAVRRMKASESNIRCIVLTTAKNEGDLLDALSAGAGADGYLLKDIQPEDLSSILVNASTGVIVLQDYLTELLRKALVGRLAKSSPIDGLLTVREQEILECLEHGLNNKNIARDLNISCSTVKVHIKNLLRKLNLTSRLEAAVWRQSRKSQCDFSECCPFGPNGRSTHPETSKRDYAPNGSRQKCANAAAPSRLGDGAARR
jgi:two-component system nitrate/nitrite response regulator NarL